MLYRLRKCILLENTISINHTNQSVSCITNPYIQGIPLSLFSGYKSLVSNCPDIKHLFLQRLCPPVEGLEYHFWESKSPTLRILDVWQILWFRLWFLDRLLESGRLLKIRVFYHPYLLCYSLTTFRSISVWSTMCLSLQGQVYPKMLIFITVGLSALEMFISRFQNSHPLALNPRKPPTMIL